MSKIWTREQLLETFIYASVLENGLRYIYHNHLEFECQGQHHNEDTSLGILNEDITILMPMARKLDKGLHLSREELLSLRKILAVNYLNVLLDYANGCKITGTPKDINSSVIISDNNKPTQMTLF